jgi:hypothetical protein
MSDTQTSEKPKTMLILKSQPAALGSVESYLKNRGWQIHTTANLKEALVYIITKKPAFVAISIDHPNRKVRALPKILTQGIPCTAIVFAESNSSSSYKALNDMQVDYRVYPPATGPAFERCVNKYLKDQQLPANEESLREMIKSNSNFDSDSNYAVKVKHHEQKLKDNSAPAFEDDKTKDLLSQFLKNATIESTVSVKGKGPDDNLIFAQAIDEDEDEGNYQFKTETPDSIGYIPGESPTGEMNEASQTGKRAGNMGSVTEQGANGNIGTAHDGEDSREQQQKPKRQGWAPIGNDAGVHIKSAKTVNDKGETLIVRGTEKALQESVVVKEGPIKELLEDSTSVACIVVKSDRFSGYLVAVMAENRKIDQKFVDTIKVRLFKFLKDNGEDLADSNPMDIQIKQVPFEPWAVEYADFLRKSVHEGNEVAMAFFPRSGIKIEFEESHDKDMVKISLNDLEGDRKVEFDLYVYLPSNNKFLLYTPKGGVFYNKQLVKLKKQGVTHMHIPKTADQDVSKYKARNYLNDLVDDFEKKQEEQDPKKKKAA